MNYLSTSLISVMLKHLCGSKYRVKKRVNTTPLCKVHINSIQRCIISCILIPTIFWYKTHKLKYISVILLFFLISILTYFSSNASDFFFYRCPSLFRYKFSTYHIVYLLKRIWYDIYFYLVLYFKLRWVVCILFIRFLNLIALWYFLLFSLTLIILLFQMYR